MSKIQRLKRTIEILFLFMPILLTGCSSMNSKFDCPNKPGVNCRSLDQVNNMVDRGILGRSSSKERVVSKFYSIKSKTAFNNLVPTLRSDEQVIRVWIAPYQDTNNNYHNESTVYTVARKSNWAVPVEIKEQ